MNNDVNELNKMFLLVSDGSKYSTKISRENLKATHKVLDI